MESVLYDAAGHRRSPVTIPGYHHGRSPRNKGLRYPADPPTIEEIVAVMRAAGDSSDSATAAFAVPRWLHASTARQNGLFSSVALILAGFAVLVFGRLTFPRGRVGTIWLYAACALILTALAAKPLTTVSPALTRLAHNQPLYSQTGNALTADLARGLAWLRDRTDPQAVVAVNNYRDGSLYWETGWRTPDDYYYTALGERRTFLEGWVYTQRAFDIGEGAVFAGRKVPFPKRLALNEAIFQHADRHALDTVVRRFHVRYLIVDRIHNWATPRLTHLAHPIFNNRDITIYAVPAPGHHLSVGRPGAPPAALARPRRFAPHGTMPKNHYKTSRPKLSTPQGSRPVVRGGS